MKTSIKSVVLAATVLTTTASATKTFASDVLTTYAENELVLSHMWISHPGMTLGQVVQTWERDGRPGLKLHCQVKNPCAYGNLLLGGDVNACVKDVELLVKAESVSMTVNLKHSTNGGEGLALKPMVFSAKSSENVEVKSSVIQASWNDGEDSIDLVASGDEASPLTKSTVYYADLKAKPNGPAGLTVQEDLNFAITCKPAGFGK